MEKKGSFSLEYLGWLLLAAAVLVIAVIAIMIFTKSGHGALGYIKNLFRFGR